MQTLNEAVASQFVKFVCIVYMGLITLVYNYFRMAKDFDSFTILFLKMRL
jgi:hypothetical protein